MKKRIVVLGALLASVVFAAVAKAGTVVPNSARVFLASATTGGVIKSEFGVTLRPAADPEGTGANPGQITWSGALPNSTWKIADVVLRTTYTVSDANGGITIYTDNTNAAALPRFVKPLPTDAHNSANNPGGLLIGTSGTTSVPGLPIAWSIKPSSAVVNGAGANGLRIADPNDSANPDSFQWAYVVDKGNVGVDDGDGTWNPATDAGDTRAFSYTDNVVLNYISMIRASGVHGSQSPDFASGYFADPDKKAYVYLQADFSTAAAQRTYQTSRLTVEAYLQ